MNKSRFPRRALLTPAAHIPTRTSATSVSQALGTQQTDDSKVPGIRETLGVEPRLFISREGVAEFSLAVTIVPPLPDGCSLTISTRARQSTGCRVYWEAAQPHAQEQTKPRQLWASPNAQMQSSPESSHT